MTFQDAFTALYSGDTALMTLAEARLSVAYELGIPVIRFRPDRIDPYDEDALWAIDVIRSYQAVRHILEAGEPAKLTKPDIQEARMLMQPQRQAKKAPKKGKKGDDVVAAQNSLWQKTSY